MFDFSLFWQQFVYDAERPMLFHTGFFLFLFSAFLALYALVSQRAQARMWLLTAFGFYFYYKASGLFLLLLLFTISADYLFSLLIAYAPKGSGWRRLALTLGILFSLSFLLYFKYADFFLAQYHSLKGVTHAKADIILPIGISFYTFQSISYLVDTYYERFERPTFRAYLLYMTYFPHLVAGPIVRARDFLPQIEQPDSKGGYTYPSVGLSAPQLHEAIWLILKGFVKKAIIGDFVAQYSDIVFATPADFGGTELMMASLAYTLRIFCDFSGYTDMAIGISLLLGYRLCKNFDSPYAALNITDFWRRWHISLSFWLRDYVYIPLGGNRKGFYAQLGFLMATMLIGGFWHGADWKYIFWGAGHGFLLIFHKLFLRFVPASLRLWLPRPLAWGLTFVCVALLWIPFRAASMSDAWLIYQGIFGDISWSVLQNLYANNELFMYLLLLGFVATLLPTALKEHIYARFARMDFALKMLLFALAIQVFLQVQSENVQPFIYFEF